MCVGFLNDNEMAHWGPLNILFNLNFGQFGQIVACAHLKRSARHEKS